MIIELSGVQFGLKSYAWFEITSMISDQNSMIRVSITTFLHPFWNCSNTGLQAGLKLNSFIFFFFVGGGDFAEFSPHVAKVFGVASSLAGKNMRFKAKNGAIRE